MDWVGADGAAVRVVVEYDEQVCVLEGFDFAGREG